MNKDNINGTEYLSAVFVAPAHVVGAVGVRAIGMRAYFGGYRQLRAHLPVERGQARP